MLRVIGLWSLFVLYYYNVSLESFGKIEFDFEGFFIVVSCILILIVMVYSYVLV